MEMWTEVRRRVLTGELSKRAACQEYGINWRTLGKMLAHAEPPGYRRRAKREKPILGPHLAWIHEVLEQDKKALKKQHHTAQRIFDRLKAERDYTGGVTMVKAAVREWKDARKEVFVPISHPPGEAQVDFGFAYVDVAGERQQVALFVMTLPYSDVLFSQAFPRECTEAFLEGHNRAFRFIGGVPRKIRYDNSKIAVAGSSPTASMCSAVGWSAPPTALELASSSGCSCCGRRRRLGNSLLRSTTRSDRASPMPTRSASSWSTAVSLRSRSSASTAVPI